MDNLTIIRQLSASHGRNDKEEILYQAFLSGNREFFTAAKLTYDKLISFGIAKIVEIADDDLKQDDFGSFSFEDFIVLADKLRKRELTGHAARDAINNSAQRCHGPSWNELYRRILLKDLKIGCDEATINKVLKKITKRMPEAFEYFVPVFECQLAVDGMDEVHQKKIKGKKLCDLKIDGTRCLAILDKLTNKVELYTRNGHVIQTCPEVRETLTKVLEKLPGSVVLDGELVSKFGFQHMMTVFKAPDRDTSMVRFAMFDIIPFEDFRHGICKIPQWKRHEILSLLETSGLLKQAGGYAFVIEKKEIDLDTPEGKLAFEEFNREVIDAGYEGIMIKDPDANYETRRWAAWLKKKPVISVTLEIVGIEEGKPEGKYRGTLGALVGRIIENGKIIESNVSGFTDKERAEIWADKDNMLGMFMEVEADKLTLETGKEVWSLRFPRFKGFRGTQPGEKI